MVRDSSLCGLGKTAQDLFLPLFFISGWSLDHVVHKVCPAHICQAMKEYRIDPEKCVLVPSVREFVRYPAFLAVLGYCHVIDQEKCAKCGACFEAVPLIP